MYQSIHYWAPPDSWFANAAECRLMILRSAKIRMVLLMRNIASGVIQTENSNIPAKSSWLIFAWNIWQVRIGPQNRFVHIWKPLSRTWIIGKSNLPTFLSNRFQRLNPMTVKHTVRFWNCLWKNIIPRPSNVTGGLLLRFIVQWTNTCTFYRMNDVALPIQNDDFRKCFRCPFVSLQTKTVFAEK